MTTVDLRMTIARVRREFEWTMVRQGELRCVGCGLCRLVSPSCAEFVSQVDSHRLAALAVEDAAKDVGVRQDIAVDVERGGGGGNEWTGLMVIERRFSRQASTSKSSPPAVAEACDSVWAKIARW
jgi:ferredoxin